MTFRTWAIGALYTIAYNVENSNHADYNNLTFQKLRDIPIVDEFTLKEFFGKSFIPYKSIVWDVDSCTESVAVPQVEEIPQEVIQSVLAAAKTSSTGLHHAAKSVKPCSPPVVSDRMTSKEDLYLAPPRYPRMDTSSVVFAQKSDYDRISMLYQSLPKVPTTQNEISITTDVNSLVAKDLAKLFPTQLIQTRKPALYQQLPKVDFDNDLGSIIPVPGFTKKQLRDNIIKYPHLYQLKREVGGKLVPFHAHIEIDGELKVTADVWDSLPIAKLVPKTSDYMLEYVTRKYLLERDLHRVDHVYPMYGDLKPFLTLFAPPSFYAERGYKDPECLAKLCVQARVDYRKSRNGVIHNSGVSNCIFAPFCFHADCGVVCPTYQQTLYLLSQNDIELPNSVYSLPKTCFDWYEHKLANNPDSFCVIQSDKVLNNELNPNDLAKLCTYCAICDHWKGSKFSMIVYHLKFSKYMEKIKSSWSSREESDDLQYMRIWANTAKVLVISNLDFVSFGDTECQTLLQLLQDRDESGKFTIVVCKNLHKLVGRSSFFGVFIDTLKGGLLK